jgi:hypothetical protein
MHAFIQCINFVFCFFLLKSTNINPLNAQLNPSCHLLALLGAHHILHVSRIRVKIQTPTILPFALHGHKKYTDQSPEQQVRSAFQDRRLRRKCEPKREELKANWRKPHNGKLHHLRSSPIIHKSMRMRWTGKISRTGRNRNFCHGFGRTS